MKTGANRALLATFVRHALRRRAAPRGAWRSGVAVLRSVHFRASPNEHPLYEKPARLANATDGGCAPAAPQKENVFDNQIWTDEEMKAVNVTHQPPKVRSIEAKNSLFCKL